MTQSDKAAVETRAESLDALARKKTSVAHGVLDFFTSTKKWRLLPTLVIMLLLTPVTAPFV